MKVSAITITCPSCGKDFQGAPQFEGDMPDDVVTASVCSHCAEIIQQPPGQVGFTVMPAKQLALTPNDQLLLICQYVRHLEQRRKERVAADQQESQSFTA